MKLWERVTEARLKGVVTVKDRQYGFQKGKPTVQPMYCLRVFQEKMREHQTDMHMVFVVPEKVYTTPGIGAKPFPLYSDPRHYHRENSRGNATGKVIC